MEAVYNILRGCSFIGDFLAYQYTIDFNYSPYLNFSENSFVKAGIGAIRGIKNVLYAMGIVLKMRFTLCRIIFMNFNTNTDF